MADSKTTNGIFAAGNYKVVSFALDLTGKELIDEICHIGAFFHPDQAFSQYVMPSRKINRSSGLYLGIRIFTSRRLRVLKNLRTKMLIKTKSTFSTLNEFIDWMKTGAEDNTDGIILAYHANKMNNMLSVFVDALRRYNLLDDFFALVKGFVNCHAIAVDKLVSKERSITLKALLRKFLDDDEANSLENAKKRARVTYEILSKILKTDGEIHSDLVRNYVTGRDEELENLKKQKVLTNQILSLLPIFAPEFRKEREEHGRAVVLRRYLIDMQINYESLQSAYDTGSRDGIVALVCSSNTKTQVAKKIPDKKKKQDLKDLADLVIAHFTNGTGNGDLNITKLWSKSIAGEPTNASVATDSDVCDY